MNIVVSASEREKPASAQPLPWMSAAVARLEEELVSRHGESQRQRAVRGLKQISDYWCASDGDAGVLEEFAKANFAGNQAALDTMFARFESLLEQYDGHSQEIVREFRTQSDLERGPILPFDEIFAGYDPSAHFLDDSFQNRLAFVILLNFSLTTLDERLTEGRHWSRRQWAEVRLAQRFSKRIPAHVSLAIAKASSDAERYITEYNIWMHQLVDAAGTRLFPPNMRLLSHWNLRDEIKADYADAENGLAKQRTIQRVMERIISQEIPAIVINNPAVDWDPFTNRVAAGAQVAAEEPDTRYRMLLDTFQAARQADPYSPTAPTLIARRFDENREIPEPRVRAMLEQVVASPLVGRVAALIRRRLGRSLEPFDIWYNGFRAKSRYSEAELDQIVAKRYPTPEAYGDDISNLLVKLGFTPSDAERIAASIVVDPGRGAGHAMGSGMRAAKAHLRTRIGESGMNYKGFNIAAHEMGHNVEQTLSMKDMDHWLLHGVPNTAFTEALAFVFQARDLELLGLQSPDGDAEALKTLDIFWGTYEIAGVSLVDIDVWHWMYDHPNAAPAELKQATLAIAKDIWNRYYASVFNQTDVALLAIYSHMIDGFLYLPDYPVGHLIAFQIEEQIRKAGSVGPEFKRMVSSGCVAPDLWMQHATGAPVGPDALLSAAARALDELQLREK
jgi:hypothetical protein